jgi:hypothetical protein
VCRSTLTSEAAKIGGTVVDMLQNMGMKKDVVGEVDGRTGLEEAGGTIPADAGKLHFELTFCTS